MGKFGHSHSRQSSYKHGKGHFNNHRTKPGFRNNGAQFEIEMGLIQKSANAVPNFAQGVYTFKGPQIPLQVQMQNFYGMNSQHMQTHNGMPIHTANITVVGDCIQPASLLCFNLTFFLGAFLLFPLLLMCCMWWKKMTYPLYSVHLATYQSLANMINEMSGLTNLSLTIIDNTFNAQKATLLCQLLSRSRVTSLTFLNKALPCNLDHNEFDDFSNSMRPIKSLQISSTITWGQTLV